MYLKNGALLLYLTHKIARITIFLWFLHFNNRRMKNFCCLIFLVLNGFAIWAQNNQINIYPTVQSVHSADISFFDTCNEKYLLLTSSKREVILWNTQTGLKLRSIQAPFTIRGAALCNNGEELAVLMYDYGKDASLRFYSTRTGNALDTLSFFNNNLYNGISWKTLDLLVRNKTGNQFFVKAFDEAFVIDADKKKRISAFKLKTYDSKVAFSPITDQLLLAYQKEQNNVFCLVNFNGQPIKEIAADAETRSLATGKNAFYALAANGKIAVMDAQLNLLDNIVTLKPISKYSPPVLSISDDDQHLVAALNDENLVYNLPQKKWINKKQGIYGSLVAVTPDAKQLAVLRNDVQIVELSTGKKLVEQENYVTAVANLRLNPAGSILATGKHSAFSSYTRGINLHTGALFRRDDALKQWLTDTTALCVKHEYLQSGESTYLVQINQVFSNQTFFSFSKAGYTVTDAAISTDQQKLAVLAADKLTLFIASGSNFSNVKTVAIKSASARGVIFSPNGKYIAISGEENIKVYDIEANKWILGTDQSAGYGFTKVVFSPDSKTLWYQYSGFDEKKPDLKDLGFKLKGFDIASASANVLLELAYPIGDLVFHPTGNLFTITYLDGLVELRNTADLKLLFAKKLHSNAVNEAMFHPTKKWLLTTGDDYQTVITNYENQLPVAKAVNLYHEGKSGFAIFTPLNNYMVPAANVAGLHYVDELKTYTFKQFDYRFNRPDKVLRALESPDTALINSYRKAYEKRIKKLGIDTALFNTSYSVPTADFANRTDIAFEQKDNKLLLKINAKDANNTLDRLNIWVNEVPIYGVKGLDLKALKQKSVDTSLVILLSNGNNKIEASVINSNGIESYRLPLIVNYTPAAKPIVKLYFVGIGINEFSQQGHNLQWSVKDIRDLANKLKEKYGSEIAIDTLFNAQVNTAAVLALKEKLKNTDVNDRVIVAYSGHGLLSSNYDYFLSTYSVDFDHPEKNGLAYDSFEDLLDNIPARQKLMLIDACHSGEVDKEELLKMNQSQEKLTASGVQSTAEGETPTAKGTKVKNLSKGSKLGMKNSFELMQELFANVGKGTGATIISAAGGMQYALEKNSLKNGVFTYSILEYMNEARTVGIQKLKDRVNERVVQLTAGLQQPTSRAENNIIDWPVW